MQEGYLMKWYDGEDDPTYIVKPEILEYLHEAKTKSIAFVKEETDWFLEMHWEEAYNELTQFFISEFPVIVLGEFTLETF